MKKYTVAVARERFAQALDAAQRGEPVYIERKGVTYRLIVEKRARPAGRRSARIEVLDPAVEAGQWSWDWSPGRLAFREPRRARGRGKR